MLNTSTILMESMTLLTQINRGLPSCHGATWVQQNINRETAATHVLALSVGTAGTTALLQLEGGLPQCRVHNSCIGTLRLVIALFLFVVLLSFQVLQHPLYSSGNKSVVMRGFLKPSVYIIYNMTFLSIFNAADGTEIIREVVPNRFFD